ncbi:MAG: TetR/AcrR family transcriptional regulator [Chloroflexi bacterium]|nr:MAG: TetR/AcrR family transcriptional regulator [Chloroflexota bacterium]MBL1196386.1 TetR/AcrR family transcriptional regulator [Chloroflexota bacterium]NOH13681.1 TetR/AcrR family transcriptional regulator [Chloroflexota bacterium]
MTTSIEQDKVTDKRTVILQTTLQLLSERGFHNTPMSLIAEEAGVAAGTIYRYFDNKETLINELFLDLKREMLQHAMARIEPGDTTEEQFRKVWRNFFHYYVTHEDEMRFVEQHHNSPFQSGDVLAAVEEMYAPFANMFAVGVADGSFRELPMEMTSVYIYDVVLAFAKRQLSGKLKMTDELLEEAVQISWDAVKGT